MLIPSRELHHQNERKADSVEVQMAHISAKIQGILFYPIEPSLSCVHCKRQIVGKELERGFVFESVPVDFVSWFTLVMATYLMVLQFVS